MLQPWTPRLAHAGLAVAAVIILLVTAHYIWAGAVFTFVMFGAWRIGPANFPLTVIGRKP